MVALSCESLKLNPRPRSWWTLLSPSHLIGVCILEMVPKENSWNPPSRHIYCCCFHMPSLEHRGGGLASYLASLKPVFPSSARLSTVHLLEFSSAPVTLLSEKLNGW